MKVILLDKYWKEKKFVKCDIWRLLCEADTEFYPPLSVRDAENVIFDDKNQINPTGKPYVFYHEVMNQVIFVAVDKNHIRGFLAFEVDYLNEDIKTYRNMSTWYVNALVVDNEYRRKGIASRLYEALEEYANGRTNDIYTRTWSKNISHIDLVKKRGYELVIRLVDHRGSGIDTVYFRKIINRQS
jgi:ribosomal protein S18 acetylase RimI-like enzyme